MTGNTHLHTILVLDDEEMVVTTLRSLFRLQTDYNVLTFTSPLEALEAAAKHTFDIVITDYLMPEMDGITFLEQFKEIQPQAIRILLTGYADKENAIRAINTVGLYQYVEKPWDNDALLMIVKNGLDKRNLIRALQEKVAQLDSAHTDLKNLQNEIIKAFM